MIHGPSLGIGAGITAVSIIVSFLVFDATNNQQELQIMPAQDSAAIPTDTSHQESQKTDDQKMAAWTVALQSNGSPILGDPNAPITLIEFGDYQCHFCNVYFHQTEHDVIRNYVDTGKIKILFKDFTIIGPDSINAAHATHCANDQDSFWQYHDTLYNHWTGENNGWASSDNLLKFAEIIDLDIDEFTSCMTESRHVEIIGQNNEDARTLELTGTPAFFTHSQDGNIVKFTGAQPYQSFANIIDSELENHNIYN